MRLNLCEARTLSTRDRILDAAESLFAEHGFTVTSMRMITSQANVNLASVNYHFGSKEVLIQEVFVRILDPLTTDLAEELDGLDGADCAQLSVERLLQTFIRAAMDVNQRTPDGASIFMQLMGRSFAEPQQGHLRKFLSNRYRRIVERYQMLFGLVLPDLPACELFWRLHYMLGAAGFTLSGLEGLRKIAARDFEDSAGFEQQIKRLVPFLAAGLSAPIRLDDTNTGKEEATSTTNGGSDNV